MNWSRREKVTLGGLSLAIALYLGFARANTIPRLTDKPEPAIINLNEATVEMLEKKSIPRSIAEEIVRFRKLNGPYRSYDDLHRVPNITGSVIQELRQCARL